MVKKTKTIEKVEKQKNNGDKLEYITDAAGNREKKIIHSDGSIDIIEE